MSKLLWYEVVASGAQLTQGDLIPDCPLVAWRAAPIKLEGANETEALRGSIDVIRADVVVMTQACDLEHNKVRDVILCPHVSLIAYRAEWENALGAANQNPTERAWKRHCDDICDGFMWNLAMLNEGGSQQLATTHRIVNFHDVFTVPRVFLQTLLSQRKRRRLRLRPPYREHLSQAFARFFMRVGLPVDMARPWRTAQPAAVSPPAV